jgi:hypothetical protein
VGHFKPSKKPKEAGGATRCGDCNYAKECVWEAKKIYVDPLSQVEDSQRVSRGFLLILDTCIRSLSFDFSGPQGQGEWRKIEEEREENEGRLR